MKFVYLTIALLILIVCPFSDTGSILAEEQAQKGSESEKMDIGQNRVFYEIFVGSFSDSNGDGIGDLRGIINRLDYLNDGDPDSGRSLGVEGLWLTPIYSSPSYHKYDVTDYYTVDPAFGTMEELKELVSLCHERGMLVILDLPINHTGDRNKWYVNFKNAHITHNPANKYYDYYSWVPADASLPAGRHFMNVSDMRVEANFSDNMPELNFDNETIRAEVLRIAEYYLALGVDGFRFDAAKYIYYGDHDANAAFWEWYIGELKKIKPDVYTVAEVWDSDSITERYAGAVNCFNFTASQASGLIATTAAAGNVNKFTAYIEGYIHQIKKLNPAAMNMLFVANHDTDRAAGYLTVATHRMQMAANLYLLSPGSPFIYYGEEIGLRGSRGGASTDANRRLAMLWGDGDTVRDPVGATYEKANQMPYTVADQMKDETSVYHYYRQLLMIRKAHPEIAAGDYRALNFNDTKAGGFLCTLNGSTVCVLHNTTKRAVTLDLAAVTELSFDTVSAYIGQGAAKLDGTVVTLEAQTSAVLR
ncbi:MAG: alpha-amylase family glycosyl hydrolase [Clostridia bacterium]|nr:alpha-amylase family glycosyl hydrolase [Clostridia bacterium]